MRFLHVLCLKIVEAKDAFIIFDEAYEGNDVDAFYLGDILRALGCTISNATVIKHGGATQLGTKRG
jgi:Ca2+-binding EF-hand superfamily protein